MSRLRALSYYRQQIDLVAVGGGSEATDDEEPGGYSEDDNGETHPRSREWPRRKRIDPSSEIYD